MKTIYDVTYFIKKFQPTPKQRNLACLYDIYEKTHGRKYQAEPEVKERVVYRSVLIDSTVKELSGQLTNN